MIKFIGLSSRDDKYDQFLENHPKGHFMQTRMWGRHKSKWNWEAILYYDGNNELKGSLAVLIRRIPFLPCSIMYGCRGPVCDPDDFTTVRELVNGAKQLAKKRRCYLIKLDPDIKSDNTAFKNELISLGFTPPPDNKNFETIQPRYVFRLNLEGRTEEDVFKSFESKTRYNIRLAMKKGVEVSVRGLESVREFYEIMNETGIRDKFFVRNESYFRSLLTNLGENVRLYMAYYQGKPLAGSIAVKFGDKVWYLYGASRNCCRNVMPNYLLQWEMIRWAIESGCKIYDFRGVSGDISPENPLYGLYRFKKGFGGEFTEFLGEFDLVLKPFAKKLADAGKRVRHKFAKLMALKLQD
jgi:peptidoglycan pentaglycine glycine transferase (the first glycine)